ncbi:MAG: ATP-dependent DNA helicase UvrD2 [Actinobacteria bacterium]|nr:ATP-dependent DNA helicase UvrD2 [Actinomycetota bacterium]
MDADQLLNGMDADQRIAVTCPETATVLHAGAGSGKTRVLTHRIAYRIAKGTADPQRVLAITFTREAASEMRRRLKTLGVSRDLQSVTVGTFHAIALALLRQRLADTHKPMPSIIHNRSQLIAQAAQDHPMSSRSRELLVEVDWAHARMISPANYAQTAKRLGRYTAAPHNEIATIFKQYEQLKIQRNTLDLDDLIARVVEAMRTDNAYAQAVRWRYRHIFVDEAQDMNPLQYELFEAIRGQRADVFIVGDPMQAIYGWNGSDKRLFDELPDKIRGTTVLRLPNNYRCTPQILNAATTVAKLVDPQIDVRAIKPSAEPVVMRGFADAEAEAQGVVDCLWQFANTGGTNPWQSSAVLVRTNIQVELIVDALIKNNIQVRTTRPSKELNSAIADAAQSTNRNELATWVTDMKTESSSEIQRWVAEQVEIFLKLDHPGSVDGRTFTSWMRATSAEHRATEGVEVLTFHSAKGREWQCVVVAGAEVGLMPHSSAITQDQQDEEIRLAYVALTRASQQLFVTWCETRKGRTAGRSELLAEIVNPTLDTPTPKLVAKPRPIKTTAQTLEDELRTWRNKRAKIIKQPVTSIIYDEDLREIAKQLPKTTAQLAEIVGVITAQKIGPDVLSIVAQAESRLATQNLK